MREWNLPEDIRVDDVLTWILRNEPVDTLMLVVRLDPEADNSRPSDPEAAETAVRLLGDNLREVQIATAWPDNALSQDSALIFVSDVDDALVKRLAREEPLLFEWLHAHEPPLPEDFCLFARGAARPVLVTNTHESDAWLLTEKEVDLPGVTLESEPIDWEKWLFDRDNYYLRDGRRVASTIAEILQGRIRLA